MADVFLLPVGMPMLFGGTAAGLNSFTLDSADDEIQAIFRVVEDCTISHVWVRQTTLTGVAPVYRFSLQGVDGAGAPDGTIKGGGTAKNDYTPIVGNDGLGVWLALDTPLAVNAGDPLALVGKNLSGTINGSNNCSFAYAGASDEPDAGFPYCFIVVDGAPSKIINAMPCFGYKSSAKTYGLPTVTRTSQSTAIGTNPDEVGVKITLPLGMGVSYTIRGVRLFGSMATAGSIRMTLYDTDGTTVLQDVDHDSDYAGSSDFRWFTFYFNESVLSTLLTGSAYRLTLRSSGVGALVFPYLDVTDAGDMTAFQLGTAVTWTQTVDVGAWTDTPTRRPTMDVLISDLTGSGGGIGALVGGSLIR